MPLKSSVVMAPGQEDESSRGKKEKEEREENLCFHPPSGTCFSHISLKQKKGKWDLSPALSFPQRAKRRRKFEKGIFSSPFYCLSFFLLSPGATRGSKTRQQAKLREKGGGETSFLLSPLPPSGKIKNGEGEKVFKNIWVIELTEAEAATKPPSANGQMGEERPVMPQSLPGISSLSFPHRRFAPDRSEAAFPERDTKAKSRIGESATADK